MENNTIVKQHTAETVYINHPEFSYAIFCFNSAGDLFINSDWGMYGYAWRSFGDNFKTFLSRTNAEYVVGKLQINYRDTTNKPIPEHRKKALTALIAAFIESLLKQLNQE